MIQVASLSGASTNQQASSALVIPGSHQVESQETDHQYKQLEFMFEFLTGSATAEPVLWTDSEIIEAHRGVLALNLRHLRDRVTEEEERNDILHWMFMPRFTRWKFVDGKAQFECQNIDIPFSFVRCCAFAEVSAEELRIKTVAALKAYKLRFDVRYTL